MNRISDTFSGRPAPPRINYPHFPDHAVGVEDEMQQHRDNATLGDRLGAYRAFERARVIGRTGNTTSA